MQEFGQRQHEDAGGGTEVAAVDADEEDGRQDEGVAGRPPPRLQLLHARLDEEEQRGPGDEERDDPLEGRRGQREQQHAPQRPARGGDGQSRRSRAP